MKKVININFQGRVIPIEETAFDLLKQYTESLRRYFSNEDGRDEIINDIEGRIAELFSDRLKKGATCITDDDVNSIIASMGRPEDFEAADADLSGTTTSNSNRQESGYSQPGGATYSTTGGTFGRGKFSRNADDKIIGGVCSGLANYLGLDPVIMRIIFVLLFAPLFWIYILLWIIVPSQSLTSNITKRLYRNPDDKVIAGVCGGLAAYFNIQSWIPRLIFALPLILGIVGGSFNAFFWDWDYGFGPRLISGGLGSTLSLVYLVLWIAVPFASTAAEKLEMKGEKIDLNSIRDTVKGDLENFKSKAQSWGAEVKETAQQFSNRSRNFSAEAGERARSFASEAAPLAKRAGSGLGHVIGILFKAFFLFIAAIVALALFGVLMGILFGGMAVFPVKDFFLEGFWQNTLAWSSLILFLGVPSVALITWLIRRIMGVRSNNNYLGYIFGGLWIIGLFSFIFLAGLFARNFKNRAGVETTINLSQPSGNKLFIESVGSNVHYYGDEDFFGLEIGDDAPFYGISHDSLMLKTVRVNIVKSKDTAFHVYTMRFSRSNTNTKAKELAENIKFPIEQKDSVLQLQKGFAITRDDKFRNQQVLVVVEVPVGKKIELDRSLEDYEWFTINTNRRRGFNVSWDNNWDDSYSWDSNVEYVMTREGLQKTNELTEKELKEGKFKFKIDDKGVIIEGEGELKDKSKDYEYKGPDKKEKKDTIIIKSKTSISTPGDEEDKNDEEENTVLGKIRKINDAEVSPLMILSSVLQ
ncbi:PspC domain-containing protein [Flavihumibacter profundi]|uniref:PspC domain-containing protein n=1 Tax=Flavihumibacter profundi TaxID=2716883 RepID=UPI001CC6FB0F|nr:PspC domain-containing protein [Flavihumibacter profundi]MBZ5857448.1 PspC domain-containing protein [Flavihumibacter profundi]